MKCPVCLKKIPTAGWTHCEKKACGLALAKARYTFFRRKTKAPRDLKLWAKAIIKRIGK